MAGDHENREIIESSGRRGNKLRRDPKNLGQVDRKLALSFGAVVLLLMLTTSWVASFLFAELNTKEENRLSGVIAAILGESISRISFSGKYHMRLMAEEIHAMVPELAYISVETKDGRVLAHSDPAKDDTSMMEKEDVDLRIQSLDSGKPVVGEHAYGEQTFKEIVLPYRSDPDAEVVGVVRIGIDIEEARREQRASHFKLLILVSVLTAVAIWIVLVLSQRFGGTVHALATQLQGILHHAPLAISISDRSGRPMAFSIKFEDLFGRPEVKQPLKQLLEERLSHSDVERLVDTDREVFESCVNKEQDLELEIQDRFYAWHVSKFPIAMDKGGKPTLICTFIHDITERKLAEEALRGALSFAENLIEAIPDPLYYKDTKGLYQGCNSAYAKVLGLSIDDVIGKSVYDITPKELADKYYEMDSALFAKPGVQTYESVLMHANGSLRNVIVRKSTFSDHHGNLAGLIGVMVDITDRKQMEDALREKEERYRLVFDNAPLGIMHFNSNGIIQDFNDKYAEIMGASKEAIVGSHMLEGLRDPAMRQAVKNALDGERGYFDGNYTSVTGSKTTPLRAIYERIVTKEGKFMGAVGLFEDITERKRAEEERRRLEDRLQRAEKMEALGTLAGGVAHDLNHVLGIVVGYSELLANDSRESNSARSKAMEIFKGGQRAAAIVQDLLTMARRGVSNRKVLNLNNIVLECRNSPEFSMISSYHPNIRIKTDLEAHLLNISGSAVHLSKALMNLVTNATEAMPEGGVITIETGNRYLDKPVSGYDEVREGDYVVLSVSDTGEGIPAKDMKRIFEPFYTKKVMGRSGTGLGLAVIWGTVKDHQGYINVESQEGKGAIFTLYFPVTREEISREQVPVSAAEYMGNGESILIVDDVKEQRELAGVMLMKLNYTVYSVSSGEEAVEYLRQNTVDLVVLDMIMDLGMDGLDTYAKILEIHPHQKAIIVSGFSETERVSRAHALGAGAYVKKPYILEKLGLAVRKELDKPA